MGLIWSTPARFCRRRRHEARVRAAPAALPGATSRDEQDTSMPDTFGVVLLALSACLPTGFRAAFLPALSPETERVPMPAAGVAAAVASTDGGFEESDPVLAHAGLAAVLVDARGRTLRVQSVVKWTGLRRRRVPSFGQCCGFAEGGSWSDPRAHRRRARHQRRWPPTPENRRRRCSWSIPTRSPRHSLQRPSTGLP